MVYWIADNFFLRARIVLPTKTTRGEVQVFKLFGKSFYGIDFIRLPFAKAGSWV